MTFQASNGRIRVTDALGVTIFDTEEKYFTVTDILSGSTSVPRVGVGFNGASSRNLGSIDPAATDVIGAFTITGYTGGSVGGVPPGSWFSLGGSYYGGAVIAPRVASMVVNIGFDFYVSGSALQFRWYANNSGGPGWSVQLAGFTVQYTALCGAYI